MSGALPVSPGFSGITVTSEQPTVVSIAQDGRRQVRLLAGHRWKMKASYPDLTEAEFRVIDGFVMSQQGRMGSFTVVPPDLATPQGVGGGTPVVKVQNNQALYSEQFDNAAWTKIDTVSVTPNTSGTADTILDNSNTTDNYIYQNISIANVTGEVTASVYFIKDAVGRATRFPSLRVTRSAGGVWEYAGIKVDTLSGEYNIIGSSANLYGGVEDTTYQGIPAWRAFISSTGVDPLNTNLLVALYPCLGSGAGWINSATVTGSVEAGGLCVEQGGLGPYTPTTSAPVSVPPSGNSMMMSGLPANAVGWLKAGDVFSIAGQNKVYMVTSDVGSGVGKNANVSFQPALIATPADGATITVNNVPFTMMLSSDTQSYQAKPGMFFSYSLDMEEVI